MDVMRELDDSKLHTLETLWALFFIMCIIGWIYETVLEVVIYHWGFSNRGLLFGPWLPIYGVGGLLYVGSCYPLVKSGINTFIKVIGVFYITMLIATTVELASTYIFEAVRGGWPWDYTNYGINFQGRIALSTSIRFGLLGLLGMFIVYPVTEKLCGKARGILLHAVCAITLLMFITDTIWQLIKGVGS